MLNKMRENPKTTTRNVVIVVALLLFICGLLRGCSLQMFPQYQMVLNGDAEMELVQNSEYVDPSVTFYEETFFGGQKQVSDETQARLEKELVITGLDTLDVSNCDEYIIRYQYGDQVLERLIKVVKDGQQSGGNTTNPEQPGNTEQPGNNTQNPGETQKPEDNNNTGNKPVYQLPSNVTFNSRTFTYDGENHTIVVNNLPEDIIPVYHGNTRRVVGTHTAVVEFVLADSIKNDYSAVEPASMTATLTICKATPEYQVPTGLTATVGQTLKDVELPEGFTFEDALTTSVGAEGVNVFKVTFTPKDTRNYKTVKGIEVQITVTNPNGGNTDTQKVVFYLPSYVTFEGATRTYNTHPQSIFVRNLPNGIIPVYSGNGKTNAGTYTVRVTFILSDELKETCFRVEPASMEATLTILKAVPKYNVPTNLTAVEGSTLRNVKLPKGFTFQDSLSTSVGPVGTNTFKVTFTPDDVNNYETVTDIDVNIHVTKKGGGDEDPTPKPTLNLRGVTFAYNASGTPTYDPSKTYTASLNGVSGYERYITATITGDKTATTAGTHTATVTFSLTAEGARKYSGISPSSLTATLTIKKATPTGYTVPTGLTATENTTLSTVNLGDSHFKWKNPNQNVGSASTTPKEFTAIYTPTDPNYEAVEVTVKVKVNSKPAPVDPKETLNLTGVTFAYNVSGTPTYDPSKTYTATVSGLGNNAQYVKCTITGDETATTAGTHTAKVTFSLTEEGVKYYNGVNPSSLTATLIIGKATPSYTVPTGLTATVGQTLNDVKSQLPNGFTFEDPLTTSVGNAGTHTFNVTYKPSDTTNYKVVEHISVTITVTNGVTPPVKTTLDMTGVKLVYVDDASGAEVTSATYDPSKSYTAKVVGYNSTYVEIDGDITGDKTAQNVGTYNASVTFKLTTAGESLYNGLSQSTFTAKLVISEKKPDPVTPEKPIITGPSGNITVYKGESLDDLIASWTATDSKGNPVPGKFELSNGDEIVFVPNDTSKYETVKTGVIVEFKPDESRPGTGGDDETDNKVTITGPAGNITVYKDESLDQLIAGWTATDSKGNPVPGKFELSASDEIIFVPTDTDKYETVNTGVMVEYKPDESRPGTGGDDETDNKITIAGPAGNITVYNGENLDQFIAGWTATDSKGNLVSGEFKLSANGEVIFVPTDTGKYETAGTGVMVEFKPDESRPGAGGDDETDNKVNVTGPAGNITVYNGESLDQFIAGWTATDSKGNPVSGSFELSANDEVIFVPTDSKYETVGTGVTVDFNPFENRPDTSVNDDETIDTSTNFTPTESTIPADSSGKDVETTIVPTVSSENGETSNTSEHEVETSAFSEEPATPADATKEEGKKEEDEEAGKAKEGEKDENGELDGEGEPEEGSADGDGEAE